MRYFSIEKKKGKKKNYYTLHLKDETGYIWIFGKYGSKQKALNKARMLMDSKLNETRYKAEEIRIKE